MFCVWGLFQTRQTTYKKVAVARLYYESRLKSSFRKFYGRYNDLVCDYKLSLAHMLNDLFHVNFPFLCSNIPLSPAYGVYISQLIRYARACFAYEDFSKRGKLLTKKLMLQGYNESRLKSSFCKFFDRYNDLVCDYKLSLAHVLKDMFHTICYTVISILALTTGNPVYLISTKGARRVWPVSRGCLLLRGTWSYLFISWGPCCPTLDYVFALWIMITFDTLLTLLFHIMCTCIY